MQTCLFREALSSVFQGHVKMADMSHGGQSLCSDPLCEEVLVQARSEVDQLKVQLARARKSIEFFSSGWSDEPFDWEGYLAGETELLPPEVAWMLDLEDALRGLIARIRAVGGYATPGEQDALWRAERVLASSRSGFWRAFAAGGGLEEGIDALAEVSSGKGTAKDSVER